MDFKEIKELIRVFDKSELNKLKVKEGEFEICMKKGFDGNVVTSAPVAIPQQTNVDYSIPAPAQSSESNNDSNSDSITGETINSPMVGTFYASPSPGAPTFIKVGDTVKKGQTLCILEAMKIMNEVEAEFDCKIIDILVSDSNPVEYDMPLFVIERI